RVRAPILPLVAAYKRLCDAAVALDRLEPHFIHTESSPPAMEGKPEFLIKHEPLVFHLSWHAALLDLFELDGRVHTVQLQSCARSREGRRLPVSTSCHHWCVLPRVVLCEICDAGRSQTCSLPASFQCGQSTCPT